MKTKPADFSVIAGFCILLILAVSMTGCTGANAETTNPPVTTPAQPAPAETAATMPQPSSTMASTPVTPATTQPAQSQDPVSLTVNSVTKQTKVYTLSPKPGNAFLVLDITVENNAVKEGFDLSDTSLSLSYARSGSSPVSSITAQVRGGLENPIIMPTTIEQNDKRTGQVVFGVDDGSGKYTLNLIGNDGTVQSSAAITL